MIACRPSRPKQRSVAQSFSARKRRPSGEAYSLRLTTSSSTRRYSGTRLNARRRSSGRRQKNDRAVHRREQPLVRVDADRVGPLPAGEVVAQLRADRGGARVGRVDVEPDARGRSPVGDRGHGVDGRRRGRADGRDDRAGAGRGRAGRAAARTRRRPATVRTSSSSSRAAFVVDECVCSEQTTTRRSGAAARAAASAVIRPDDARVLDVAVERLGQAEQLPQPVERHLLELLQRRRGAPEDADLVEPGDQQLGQDPGLGAGRREVGEVARALPVRDPRHQDLVQVAQHGGERLRRARAATRAARP